VRLQIQENDIGTLATLRPLPCRKQLVETDFAEIVGGKMDRKKTTRGVPKSTFESNERSNVFFVSDRATRSSLLPLEIYDTTRKNKFCPLHFFSGANIQSFKAADKATSRCNDYPHLAGFPIILRLLYSCGLRVGEASRLQWRDIDLVHSTILIRASKGDKDRLVVMSRQMRDVLKEHSERQESKDPESPVFIGCFGGTYSPKSIYRRFRVILFPAGISHGGIGKGPRLHDLRHTFAVHNLEKWLKAKANMNVNLSILADYLGHTSLNETQSYLRLMPSIYPEIVSRMEKTVGKEIRRQQNETN